MLISSSISSCTNTRAIVVSLTLILLPSLIIEVCSWEGPNNDKRIEKNKVA